ncbi:MAG: NAD-dependent epimerase/dehydratase family protein, partial [Pseudomonadota bacterium]|nr:NAD-dependent epimerase/dehydratase family protein [Pseudomonadota bacterium]
MDSGNSFRRAALFGSSGGIGAALCTALADRDVEVWAGSRAGLSPDPRCHAFAFDLAREDTIAAAAAAMADTPPDLVIVASGVLTLADGTGPERSYRQIDAGAMDDVFRLNTIGP